jgi:peroxiredoxin
MVLLLVTILIACVLVCMPAVATAAAAPDFTLPDLGGKDVSLSDFKGKVILINFWATTCAPCKAEMPSLHSLYLDFRDRGLVVLAVALNADEKPVRAYIDEKKYSFPVLLDKEREVYFDTYALLGLPVTIIVDRKGSIVEKVIGERQWNKAPMRDKIIRLLEAK